MSVKKKVLLMEDEKIISAFIHEILVSKGFDVSCYDNADSALDHLQEECFDVIITDYRMQGIDGVEAVRRLRARCPAAFIIGISAETRGNAFFAAGADAFLGKPFSPGELLTIISQ